MDECSRLNFQRRITINFTFSREEATLWGCVCRSVGPSIRQSENACNLQLISRMFRRGNLGIGYVINPSCEIVKDHYQLPLLFRSRVLLSAHSKCATVASIAVTCIAPENVNWSTGLLTSIFARNTKKSWKKSNNWVMTVMISGCSHRQIWVSIATCFEYFKITSFFRM